MPMAKKPYENAEVIDLVEYIIADTTLTVRDLCVRVSASPTTGAITITLANVSEMRGKFVAIYARDADGTNTVTIQDNDESEGWTNITLSGPGDGNILYSDGMKWWSCCAITSG